MDEFLFSEQLEGCRSISEKTSYLEILNYSDRKTGPQECHSLSSEDFDNFLKRRGVFAPVLGEDSTFKNGIRLVLQQDAKDPYTFSPQVISLPASQYQSLVREMQLPYRWLETSSVVGPFFWWRIDENDGDPVLQLVFRKSDVSWNGNSRGWEMALSHSFKTRTTSGFAKGTTSAKIESLLRRLTACAIPTSHPLLLPVLILGSELSSKNDDKQRECRDKLRQLESALSMRYKTDPAPGYTVEADVNLDAVNCDLTNSQCEVLWKRPQAWQNVVKRLQEAVESFWENIPPEQKVSDLDKLHKTILCRLKFVAIKLDGLENYAHVTLERLSLQREVMYSILDQRESRLNLEIAIQQQRLADSSRRDSMSMKTLTLLGSFLLPGTFLSSIFSMTFFDFSSDMKGPVSVKLWIYFAVMVPLTVAIVGAWFAFDKRSKAGLDEDTTEAENRMLQLEKRITKGIRDRTGARVKTWDIKHV